jgi:uncharacterized protein (DUF2384 family)
MVFCCDRQNYGTVMIDSVHLRNAMMWRWLGASKRQFHSRSPLRLVATEAGARLVEELLYQIDEGMAA